MKLSSITLAAAGAIMASGCHSAKNTGGQMAVAGEAAPVVIAPGPAVPGHMRQPSPAVMPKAVAYRMSGPYSLNVPVNVNAAGDIVSYPAPTDLGPDSTPIDLGGGWWLDRRGVSANSVFTRYTYDEYRALKTAPTLSELKAAVIPGARVSETVTLPMTLSEAEADLPAVKAALPTFTLPR